MNTQPLPEGFGRIKVGKFKLMYRRDKSWKNWKILYFELEKGTRPNFGNIDTVQENQPIPKERSICSIENLWSILDFNDVNKTHVLTVRGCFPWVISFLSLMFRNKIKQHIS